jgi:hypothetical protein
LSIQANINAICNGALDQIRARATVNLTVGANGVLTSDGTLAGNVITRQFWARLDSLARAAPWNTHRQQLALTLLQARQGVPENPSGTNYDNPMWPWLYCYALPMGVAESITVYSQVGGPATQTITVPAAPMFLRARYILRQIITSTGTPPLTTGPIAQLPYPAGQDRITPDLVTTVADTSGTLWKALFCNHTQAQLIYTARIVDPGLWDPEFVDAAQLALAVWIEQAINGNNQLQGGLIQRANEYILQARIADANEQPERMDRDASWISARDSYFDNGYGGDPSLQSSLYGPAWDAMSWPQGAF